jgi:hypothetical protein
MILDYPQFSEIKKEMQSQLYPLFSELKDGLSELTFASIYLFRNIHRYEISRLENNLLFLKGNDNGKIFFMLPFGIPQKNTLDELFDKYISLKCVSQRQVVILEQAGYEVKEDRDNFDYIYLKEELANLPGKKYHKKRNLIRAFINNYNYEGRPFLDEYIDDAVNILDQWHQKQVKAGDYDAAKEALQFFSELKLCGALYYIEGKPAAYVLGEELGDGISYAIHFEKAINYYKGIYQFINKSFSSLLPDKYKYINREQDLGIAGLRQAKMTYRPHKLLKKYRVSKV